MEKMILGKKMVREFPDRNLNRLKKAGWKLVPAKTKKETPK
jgi:hypothetical protein